MAFLKPLSLLFEICGLALIGYTVIRILYGDFSKFRDALYKKTTIYDPNIEDFLFISDSTTQKWPAIAYYYFYSQVFWSLAGIIIAILIRDIYFSPIIFISFSLIGGAFETKKYNKIYQDKMIESYKFISVYSGLRQSFLSSNNSIESIPTSNLLRETSKYLDSPDYRNMLIFVASVLDENKYTNDRAMNLLLNADDPYVRKFARLIIDDLNHPNESQFDQGSELLKRDISHEQQINKLALLELSNVKFIYRFLQFVALLILAYISISPDYINLFNENFLQLFFYYFTQFSIFFISLISERIIRQHIGGKND